MQMNIESTPDRSLLTFEQAEGTVPLPTQLQLGEISTELRAVLWKVVYESIDGDTKYPSMGGHSYLADKWKKILYDKHILRDHRMADDFDTNAKKLVAEIKSLFSNGDYVAVFGFLQFVIRHNSCPFRLDQQIAGALRYGRAAYRVVDGKTITPVGSETELKTLERAFSDLSNSEFGGARAHLRNAASELTLGNFANSVRESIHSVETVARTLAPSGKLSEALAKLEKTSSIHGSLKAGFNNIYGYTSDEKGFAPSAIE